MGRAHVFGIGLVAAAVLTSGCFGPFNLTRRLYNWNSQIQEKWGREVAFLVMVVLPVYEFASLGDALVFNTIEFWGGQNPVTPPTRSEVPNTRRIVRGDEEGRLRWRQGTLTLELLRQGQTRETLHFTTQADGPTVLTNASGQVLAQAQTLPDGAVLLTDASGTPVGTYSADDLQAVFDSASR